MDPDGGSFGYYSHSLHSRSTVDHPSYGYKLQPGQGLNEDEDEETRPCPGEHSREDSRITGKLIEGL